MTTQPEAPESPPSDRRRTDMRRQTFLLIGVIGGLVALFTAIG